MENTGRQRYTEIYLWLMVALGAPICLYSAYHLPFRSFDLSFVLLAVITAFVGSRIGVEIPRIGGRITVADTLVFLTMLLYGGEAAILLATAETICSSLDISKKPRTVLSNAGIMACSTFLTVWTLRLAFRPPVNLRYDEYSTGFILAICAMALVQYAANSGLVAIGAALKTDQPFWFTWKKYYLWTSITYFVGASAAVCIARATDSIGFYGIAATTPIMVIIYVTYKTYLKNVSVSEEQAHQAELHVEELSRYIAEQERIREQYSQVEKMSALGELASGVAHDFNNTLASILGRAQLTLKGTNDPEVRRSLEIIVRSAQDGAHTVRRIQDFARQRRDHDFEPVAIDQLLLDVREITRPRWKDSAQASNIHINLELEIGTNASVRGDASELREILVNMIFNAVDAMPDGGRLTLAVKEIGGRIEIRLSDTGIGMSPEVRSRIFDPFFTTKGMSGMGLGLAVSYGIIRRHEGTIEVESEVGIGTTFRISLPLADEVIAAPQHVETTSTHLMLVPSLNAPRILVVDDERSVRELLSEILVSEGYHVTVAESGAEALMIFDAGRFDALFTDVGMPGMSGWELARAVRTRAPELPMAVITGWGEAVGSAEQQIAEVNWVLTKPFNLERIVEIAREISKGRDESVEFLPVALAV